MDDNNVLILVASFNRAHLIIETLESIKNQTHKNFTCFIIDDNSTDTTEKVVNTFCKLDSRFYFFKKPSSLPQGLSATRNFGLDIAKDTISNYIQFFDDDDIMHPQKIEKQLIALKASNADMSLCGIENFKDSYTIENKIFNFPNVTYFPDDYLTGKIFFGALTPLFRKDYIGENRFDERLHYAEEWELFCRLFYTKAPSVVYINQILFYRRKHKNSITLGIDSNYQIKKTRNIVRYILNDFLTENKLHTNKSLLFFANTFLFNFYEKTIVDKLKLYCDKQNNKREIKIYIIFAQYSLKFIRRFFFYFSNRI